MFGWGTTACTDISGINAAAPVQHCARWHLRVPQHTAPPRNVALTYLSASQQSQTLWKLLQKSWEFHLVTQQGRYITSTISAGSEDAPRAHLSPSHSARTHLLMTATPQRAGGQGGLWGTYRKQNQRFQRKFKRCLTFIKEALLLWKETVQWYNVP